MKGSGPVRVAWVLDNMGSGGTELNAIRVAERLDRERVDLRVVCIGSDGPTRARYEAAGCPVEFMPLASLYAPSTFATGRRFAKWLRAEQIDVVHAHDVYSNIFALPWARSSRSATVVGSRRWWFGPARRAHQIANRWAYRFAHLILVNAPGLRDVVQKKESVPPERVVYVPNFVEEDAFATAAPSDIEAERVAFGLDGHRDTIGIVANLRPEKDHPTLFEAVRALVDQGRDVQLAVIGDGESRGELEGVVERLDLGDHVVFTGHRPSRPNLHRLFDVTVLCSLTEGFPNTVLEAMAAGTPVVATDVGGIPGVLEPAGGGVLVPPGDPSALATAIAALLDEPDARRALGRKGAAAARATYHEDEVVERWHALYEGAATS